LVLSTSWLWDGWGRLWAALRRLKWVDMLHRKLSNPSVVQSKESVFEILFGVIWAKSNSKVNQLSINSKGPFCLVSFT
jgi:hypothetical protein